MALQQVPTIPETITVHLGLPNQPAENVTVPFPDYIKNVASSEIYPTCYSKPQFARISTHRLPMR